MRGHGDLLCPLAGAASSSDDHHASHPIDASPARLELGGPPRWNVDLCQARIIHGRDDGPPGNLGNVLRRLLWRRSSSFNLTRMTFSLLGRCHAIPRANRPGIGRSVCGIAFKLRWVTV
jgi:hypothetical protein